MLLFKKETGIPMKINLPFESGNKAMTGLLGGHIDAAFLGQPFSMQHYLAGKIRILGISSEKRNKFLPDVPTYKEAGYDIVEISGIVGYLISNFISSYTNKRTDEYGGDINGRCKIMVDIIKAIRKEIGDSAAVEHKHCYPRC